MWIEGRHWAHVRDGTQGDAAKVFDLHDAC